MSDNMLRFWKDLHSDVEGAINTKNAMGYMLSDVDEIMKAFVDFAVSEPLVHIDNEEYPVVDVGASFGVASIAALNKGAKKVIAVDLDQRHLDHLKRVIPASWHSRLDTRLGRFPDEVHFPTNSVKAFLLSKILHYYTGQQIDKMLKNVFDSLISGGKLFLSVVTPYLKTLELFIPQYESRVENQELWPGEIEDLQQYLPVAPAKQNPTFFHVMTPEIIERNVMKHGFTIEYCKFSTNDTYPDYMRYDGHEDAIAIAVKP